MADCPPAALKTQAIVTVPAVAPEVTATEPTEALQSAMFAVSVPTPETVMVVAELVEDDTVTPAVAVQDVNTWEESA
ncbi:MAG: hypothetical protein L3K15_07005 [Thermoplasmata archaeon]|nr:hypothetical protein [Thermoplasmata archaeon]